MSPKFVSGSEATLAYATLSQKPEVLSKTEIITFKELEILFQTLVLYSLEDWQCFFFFNTVEQIMILKVISRTSRLKTSSSPKILAVCRARLGLLRHSVL